MDYLKRIQETFIERNTLIYELQVADERARESGLATISSGSDGNGKTWNNVYRNGSQEQQDEIDALLSRINEKEELLLSLIQESITRTENINP